MDGGVCLAEGRGRKGKAGYVHPGVYSQELYTINDNECCHRWELV